jgi:thioredoxin reductase (NADPH)
MKYDLIIIGAGPAGLSAALDAEYLKLETLVLEARKAGGALEQMYPWKHVDSYLGFNGMLGRDVADKIVAHAKAAGVNINELEEVEEIKDLAGKGFKVVTKKGGYEAMTIIIATGVRGVPRKLGVPGEQLDGVSYFLPDPKKFRGKRVLVIGGGDSAADSALGLNSAKAKVWLAHRRDDLRAQDESKLGLKKSRVKIFWNTEVDSIAGKKRVEKVVLLNNKTREKTELPIDHVIICVGSSPSQDYLERIGIRMGGVNVVVDKNGMTSVPGIFAAGDIVSDIKRIPQALATGERAVYSAYKYIKNPYWK